MKKTGITVAIALAVVVVLYLIFQKQGSGTITLTGVGTVPASALTPLLPITPPGGAPVAQEIYQMGAALNSVAVANPTPVVAPNLATPCLTSVTPGVEGVFENPEGVVTD